VVIAQRVVDGVVHTELGALTKLHIELGVAERRPGRGLPRLAGAAEMAAGEWGRSDCVELSMSGSAQARRAAVVPVCGHGPGQELHRHTEAERVVKDAMQQQSLPGVGKCQRDVAEHQLGQG
jgi:hypothetical protein